MQPKPKLCVNHDGNLVCPPSKVICRDCMDRISATLALFAQQTPEKPSDVPHSERRRDDL